LRADRHHLRGLWRLARRAWKRLLALVLCGALGGLVVASLLPQAFEARAVLEVEARIGADRQALARQMQAIELRLMGADYLIGVMERHRLYGDPGMSEAAKLEALRDALRFDPIFDRFGQALGAERQLVALSIRAQGETPEKAARIANDLAQGALDLAAQQPFTALRLLPLERARSPDAAHRIGPLALALIGALAGFMAGCVQIALAYRRNPILRNAAQIEQALGLRVLASLPDMPELRGSPDLLAMARRPLDWVRGALRRSSP
jgi:hypothetical protein